MGDNKIGPLKYQQKKHMSEAARTRSERLKCPSCLRLNALGKTMSEGTQSGYKCRWCDFKSELKEK